MKTEYTSLKSPIISVKLKERGFSYEKFKFQFSEKGDFSAKKDERYDYAFAVHCISSLIDDAFDTSKQDLLSVIQQMLDAQKKYSERFPVLARQISDWICDLCLIGGLTHLIPELCRGGLYDIPFGAQFLVFEWICDIMNSPFDRWDSKKLSSALPSICEYDFASSKHYRENRETYEKVLSCALPKFTEYLISEYGEDIFSPCVKKLHMTSFGGLACCEKNVKIIEIEYLSFSECHKAFEALTGAVQYCDNLVRQALSVNSRITGISLCAKERKIISDAVRSGVPGLLPPYAKLGRKPKDKDSAVLKKVHTATEEKAPKSINLDVDFGKARELLEKSWLLSELFESDEDDTQITPCADEAVVYEEESAGKEEESGLSEWEEFVLALSGSERLVLSCILQKGDVTSLSRSLGGMPLGFADIINEKAIDICGDIVVETTDNGELSVFEDFRGELSQIIDKSMGGDING